MLALLTLLAMSALAGCTQTPERAPTAAAHPATATVTRGTPSATTTAPSTGGIASTVEVPTFSSGADRDIAFIAQLAALTWTSPEAGPGYPARFRRSALGYASAICADARKTGSATAVPSPTEQLATTDRSTLISLAVLFYCPSLAGSDKTTTRVQVATCPRAGDILVTSRMSPAMMSDNYFYSTVSYVVAFMNLTDYPVWIQPQVRWRADAIYKGGYPTGDAVWRHEWQLFSDPRAEPTTPGRLLKAGEVWRVDAAQAGPYRWRSMSLRVDPTAFVPQGCGYQPA